MIVLPAELPAPDETARAEIRRRAARVIRPAGAFERLDEVAACWPRAGTARPSVVARRSSSSSRHGVTVERVSAYPATVTGACCTP